MEGTGESIRAYLDPELIKWLDTKSKPWKPKDDTPEEIRPQLEEWLKEVLEKEERLYGDYRNRISKK